MVPIKRVVVLMAAMLMAGCANNSGLAPRAVPMTIAAAPPLDTHWWQKFQDAQLDQLIDEALKNAPDMAEAQARIDKVRSQNNLTEAQIVQPAFSLDGSAVREEFSSLGYFPPPIGGSVFNLGQLAASFSWDLDFWGKHQAVWQQSAGEMALAEAQADETRLALSESVATAYVALLADNADLGILREMESTRSQLLTIAQEQQSAKLVSSQSVLAQQSELASLHRQIDQSAQQVQIDRLQLADLLGARPERGAQIRLQSLPAVPALPASIPTDLIAGRPDIRMREAQIQAVAASAKLAKIDFYPDINLSGNIGVQSIGFNNLLKPGSDMFAVGPAIHLPVFNSSSLRAILGARYADYDLAVGQYHSAVYQAMRDIAAASVARQSLARQTLDQQQLQNSLADSRELATQRFEHGLDTAQPLLNDELAELAAQQARIELDRRSIIAELDLIRALGGWPQ